jgi:sigma-B regulation protein RsbU (phosphoserine phosphatase)
MSFTEIPLSERIKNSPVLVVDDAEFNRVIMIEMLSSIGMKHIISVGSGRECLDTLRTITPGIIFIDLMMPEMDGFACIRHIRNDLNMKNIPIIVQTAMGNADERLQVFQHGANDLLIKPINPYEMVSRLKLHMEYHHMLNDMRSYQERVAEELLIAREMQTCMLPKQTDTHALAESHGLIVNSISESSSEVGGDLWGITPLNETKVAVHIFDVAGHGVASAINAVRVHTLFRPERLLDSAPHDVLTELNHALYDQFSPSEFVTFFLGMIDLETNRLQYSVAACTESLILDRKNDKVAHLERAAIPLGVTKSAEYHTYSEPFHVGDTLLLYSDALTETSTTDIREEFLELDEIAATFKRHMRSLAAPAAQLQQRTLYELSKRIGLDNKTPDDDLTIALITRERA